MNQTIQGIEQLEQAQFNALIWALGVYQFEQEDLKLNHPQKFLIIQRAQQIIQLIQPESLPVLAFGLKNIMDRNSKQDNDLLNPLMIDIAKLIEKNLTQISPASLVTFLHTLPENAITVSVSIFTHLTACFKDEQLELSDYFKAISEFIRISNYRYSDRLEEYLSVIVDNIEEKGIILQNKFASLGYKLIELGLSIKILEQLTQIQNSTGHFKEITQLLLKAVHSKSDKLNITEYVNLFLLLPKIKLEISESINVEKTCSILVDVLYKSSVFVQSDFDNHEMVAVLIACAAMRIDNKKFVGSWVENLHLKLEQLEIDDLYKLAMSFVVYVRQFEDFYIRVHGVCCLKKERFNGEQKLRLGKVFGRVKLLVPDSPFLKN